MNTPPPSGLGETPFTQDEAQKIATRIDRFFNRLRKDYGEERFDLFTSTIQTLAVPEGMLTSNRGNMQIAQFAIANTLHSMIESVCQDANMQRESVLLYSITDLANEVRRIWKEKPPTAKVIITPA